MPKIEEMHILDGETVEIDGVKMKAVHVGGMDAMLMAIGFISGNLAQEGCRDAFVHALKNGLRHDHIATIYQNLGIVIAEAGVDVTKTYDLDNIPDSRH